MTRLVNNTILISDIRALKFVFKCFTLFTSHKVVTKLLTPNFVNFKRISVY